MSDVNRSYVRFKISDNLFCYAGAWLVKEDLPSEADPLPEEDERNERREHRLERAEHGHQDGPLAPDARHLERRAQPNHAASLQQHWQRFQSPEQCRPCTKS